MKESIKAQKLLPIMTIAIILGVASIVMAWFGIFGKFFLALAGYVLGAIVVIRVDGALIGTLQVILVIPAIFKGLGDSFGSSSEDYSNYDESGDEKVRRYEGLKNASLIVPGIALLVVIFLPIIRWIINIVQAIIN